MLETPTRGSPHCRTHELSSFSEILRQSSTTAFICTFSAISQPVMVSLASEFLHRCPILRTDLPTSIYGGESVRPQRRFVHHISNSRPVQCTLSVRTTTKCACLSHTFDFRHVVLLESLLTQHVAVFVDTLHHHAAIGLQSCIHHLLLVLWQTKHLSAEKQSRRQQSRSGAVPPTASKQRRLFAHSNQMTNK